MKKLGLFIVALLLMSSFASAGFWDWITGKAIENREYSVTLCTDSASSFSSGDFSFLSDIEYLIIDHRQVRSFSTDSEGIIHMTFGSMQAMDRITVLYAEDKYKGSTMLESFKVGDTKYLPYKSGASEGLTIKVNRIFNPNNPGSTVAVAGRCADLVVSKQVEVADRAIVANTQTAPLSAQPAKQPNFLARLFGAKTVAKLPTAPVAEVKSIACDIPSAEHSLKVGDSVQFNEKAVKLEGVYDDLVTALVSVNGNVGAISYSGETNGIFIEVKSIQKKALEADSSAILRISCSYEASRESTSTSAPMPTVISPVLVGCEFVDVDSTTYAGKTGDKICKANGKSCMWLLTSYKRMYFDSTDGKCNGKIQLDGIHTYRFEACSENLQFSGGICETLKQKEFTEPMFGDKKDSLAPLQLLCC